jgi:hypothetical protein
MVFVSWVVLPPTIYENKQPTMRCNKTSHIVDYTDFPIQETYPFEKDLWSFKFNGPARLEFVSLLVDCLAQWSISAMVNT